jgi:hypothetical protein
MCILASVDNDETVKDESFGYAREDQEQSRELEIDDLVQGRLTIHQNARDPPIL